MAEERKPKIDLKSRLQKMGAPPGATPPPPVTGSVPAPGRGPAPPPPASMPPGMPRPGMSARPPPVDMSSPLAAVAQPFAVPAAAVAVVPQPQRIEMDEGVVRQARSSSFKRGLMVGVVFGGALLALGWVAGNAASQGAAHAQGVHDAHDLAGDVLKAKDSLDQLKQKLMDGGKALIADRKFPTDLGQQLSGMNVDFAGDKLFGRRFSGVPADTTRQLFDFITRVQALNDKKDLVVSLLAKLQKPITEELSRPPGQLPISYVVVVDKDTPSSGAFLAPLAAPIAPDDKNGVPGDLTFANPRGGGNVKLPRLVTDKVPPTGAAITVVPNTFEKVCPSTTRGQIAQLMSSMNSLVDDIQGQKAEGDVISEPKPGLSDVAAKLADQLGKVN
ncbi:MAG TPA: hypothetical protein VEK07_22685 [Polyangiaceae bacterium]|nr:hypothetical protein [Polyangiaceae bacterium]